MKCTSLGQERRRQCHQQCALQHAEQSQGSILMMMISASSVTRADRHTKYGHQQSSTVGRSSRSILLKSGGGRGSQDEIGSDFHHFPRPGAHPRRPTAHGRPWIPFRRASEGDSPRIAGILDGVCEVRVEVVQECGDPQGRHLLGTTLEATPHSLHLLPSFSSIEIPILSVCLSLSSRL